MSLYIHTYIHTSIHTYIHTYIHKLYFSSNLRVAIIKANFSKKTITRHTTTKQNKTKQRKTNSILSKYLEQQFPKGIKSHFIHRPEGQSEHCTVE